MSEFHRAEERPDTAGYAPWRPVFDTLNALPISSVLTLTRAVEEESLAFEASHDIVEWMLWLPSDNVPRARSIYGAHLTGSEDDRTNITRYMLPMMQFDSEFGLVMWRRLFSDPSEGVRSSARSSVGHENLNLNSMEKYGERAWAEFPQVSAIDVAKLLWRALQVEAGTVSPCDPSEPVPDIPLPAWASGQTLPER